MRYEKVNTKTGITNISIRITTIIVTHRLSTIQNVDRIVVIDKGRIVENGSHINLMREGGYYSRVFKNQMLAKEMETLMQ